MKGRFGNAFGVTKQERAGDTPTNQRSAAQYRMISFDRAIPSATPFWLIDRTRMGRTSQAQEREGERKRERPTWKNVLRLLGRRKCDDNCRKQMHINGMLPSTTNLETGDHDKAVETQSNHKDQGPRSRDRRAQLVFLHLRRYAVGHAGITPDTRISAKDGRIIAAHHGLVRGGRSIAMEGSIGRPSASS